MNRVVSSRSGRVSYGQKWQNNIEGSNEIDESHSAASESGDGRHLASVESTEITQPGNTTSTPTSGVAAAPPPTITGQPKGQDNENQTWKGNMTASRLDHQLMYHAALKGDWLAAEILLERGQSLACDEITEKGDRALHIASAVKRTKFVRKLVEWISPSDLALHDGQGQTACCYAALSGNIEIADAMMKKNPNLITKSDVIGMTPLYKAALRGNAKMVSYFLKSINVKDLSTEGWFRLLLVTVHSKMYDVALEILEKDGSLATMRDNEEGTALHMLARLDLSDFSTSKEPTLLEIYFGIDAALNCFPRKMQPDLRLLAKKLWAEIQKLEQESVLELIREPPILHDAAKVGNVELITMLTRTYPDIIRDKDSSGYTIFHIAVMHRQENVFRLIRQIGAMKDLIAISLDENDNNILHLAGKLAPQETRKIIVSQSALQMQSELAWFKPQEVEAIVPPLCLEMRNGHGYRPRELFSEEHKSLLEKSEAWMRDTADSCMLIATIVLTVVFAAAFTPPGGNNSETGIPILLMKTPTLFVSFAISEGIALIGSIFSIMMFWFIMTSSFEEHKFLHILPYQLIWGLYGLLGSLSGAISAFTSAYFLVVVCKRAKLVYNLATLIQLLLLSVICSKIINLLWAQIRSRLSRQTFQRS